MLTLTLRMKDYLKHLHLFEDMNSECSHVEDGISLMSLDFCDVRNAELDFESELVAANVPYDKSWDSSIDYVSGTEHCRVHKDGTVTIKTFNGNENDTISLSGLIEAQKNEEVEEFIAKAIANRHVLPWGEQDAILNIMDTAD